MLHSLSAVVLAASFLTIVGALALVTVMFLGGILIGVLFSRGRK